VLNDAEVIALRIQTSLSKYPHDAASSKAASCHHMHMRRAISVAIGATALAILMQAAPVLADTTQIEMLDATPKGGPTPLTVTFKATGLSANISYAIDFGDGTVVPLPVVANSARISHVYKRSGDYVANLVRGGVKKAGVSIDAMKENESLIANACLASPADLRRKTKIG